MKRRWQAFRKAAWDSRQPRERQAIGAAALVALPLLAYLLLWQPAHSALTRLSTALPVMRTQAAQMKQQAEEAEVLRQQSQPAVLDAIALKASVEKSAAQYQLRDALDRLDALEPDSVRAGFSSVSYARWLRWVRALEREQHIRIDSVDITALPSAGMVKINATLTNGSGH